VADPFGEVEIKIEAEGGFWTSGWIKPRNGFFEIIVSLKEADVTTFWVYARDSQGQLVETDTPEFRIRHGLVPAAPPLPHSLSVEVLRAGGKPALDPVFSRGTPLLLKKQSSIALHIRWLPTSPILIWPSNCGKGSFWTIPTRMSGWEMFCSHTPEFDVRFPKERKSKLQIRLAPAMNFVAECTTTSVPCSTGRQK
jgi:hypothetical protein